MTGEMPLESRSHGRRSNVDLRRNCLKDRTAGETEIGKGIRRNIIEFCREIREMTSLERVQAMMEELGPATPDAEEVAQQGDSTWAVAFADDLIVVLELD